MSISKRTFSHTNTIPMHTLATSYRRRRTYVVDMYSNVEFGDRRICKIERLLKGWDNKDGRIDLGRELQNR